MDQQKPNVRIERRHKSWIDPNSGQKIESIKTTADRKGNAEISKITNELYGG